MSRYLDVLRKYRENRGLMADLRCILVSSKRHRAWPALSQLGIDIRDEIHTYVAGLFATHPEETPDGNFGYTCRLVESRRGEKRSTDDRVTPTERRFQQLLSSESGSELYQRVLRFVLMAKAQGIPINYERLATDLGHWGERTKAEWAGAFWVPDAVPIAGDEI